MSLPFAFLDQRPIVMAIAGSNGAGKSTFFDTFLCDCGLRFINADVIAEGLEIPAYEAAEVASAIRSSLVSQQESFIFETVLSDPVGDKVNTLAKYADSGYTVVLIFIRVDRVEDRLLVSGGADRHVGIWDLETQKNLALLQGSSDEIWCLAISPTRQTIVTGEKDGSIRIWDLAPSNA